MWWGTRVDSGSFSGARSERVRTEPYCLVGLARFRRFHATVFDLLGMVGRTSDGPDPTGGDCS